MLACKQYLGRAFGPSHKNALKTELILAYAHSDVKLILIRLAVSREDLQQFAPTLLNTLQCHSNYTLLCLS